MKIIGDNPTKATWKVPVVVHPDGARELVSGYFERVYYSYRYKDSAIEFIANPVLEARLRVKSFGRGRSAVTYKFEVKDYPYALKTGGLGMLTILSCLQDNRLKLEDGWIVGKWTFMKQGSEIYLYPADDAKHTAIKLEETHTAYT